MISLELSSETVPEVHNAPVVVGVSSCLLGTPCRYDGTSRKAEWLEVYDGRVLWVPFCPELLAGLGVPRPPIERVRRRGRWRVEDSSGRDVSRKLMRVAERVSSSFRALEVSAVLLKENSPSCGVRLVHIEGVLALGQGVVAHKLGLAGFPLFTEHDEARFGEWLAALDTAPRTG